ncbi:hypothetical protein N7454_010525 [Penicillium verhagenii]|nr:hypothetical protein N7454_010525 [Penicillium verhagenii]
MTASHIVGTFFIYASIPLAAAVGLYAILLGLLTTSIFQSHTVYFHAFQITWFKDLDIPETFGFLRNQVTPFDINSPNGEHLYAWHILPVELYRKNENSLHQEPAGLVSDIKSRVSFQLLRDDPEARLIIHMHGAGGTQEFLRLEFSFFAQSMGTAVNIAVSKHFALQNPPVVFAGSVLVAPFVDVATLVSTYRVAGTVPIISPLARFPMVFKYLQRFIRDKWLSKDSIAQYIRANEFNGEKYRLTIIHAEDDYDIPWHHSQLLFWHAVNASTPTGISYDELERKKLDSKTDLGAAGSMMEWRTNNGVIREEILKTGLHDVIMGYPVITMAVMRHFTAVDPTFTS